MNELQNGVASVFWASLSVVCIKCSLGVGVKDEVWKFWVFGWRFWVFGWKFWVRAHNSETISVLGCIMESQNLSRKSLCLDYVFWSWSWRYWGRAFPRVPSSTVRESASWDLDLWLPISIGASYKLRKQASIQGTERLKFKPESKLSFPEFQSSKQYKQNWII